MVDDQRGNPTNAADLAHHILKLAVTKEYGVYHCTGGGVCSWYEFTKEIVRLAGLQAAVTPCTSAQYKAAHPAAAVSYTHLRVCRKTVKRVQKRRMLVAFARGFGYTNP